MSKVYILMGLFFLGVAPSVVLAHRADAPEPPGAADLEIAESSSSVPAPGQEPFGLYWDYWFDGQLFSILFTVFVLYLLGVGPLRRKINPQLFFPWRKAALFTTGVVLYYFAVSSSLDEIGEEYLFTAHMLQHNIIIYVIPLFLLRGIPVWLADAVLENGLIRTVVGYFVSPLVAFVLFNLCFSLWHVPALYEWALRDKLIHDLEHTSFILVSLAMWWPIFGPSEKHLPPLRHYGLQMLYIFALAVAQLPLFAYLCFADKVHYPTYAAAARIVSMSPMEDQFVGGVLMKISAMVAFIRAWVIIFFRWAREAEDAGDHEPVATPIQGMT